MPEKILYEYAIIRYVPRVEREEFINVGIIIYSKQLNCIKLLFEINEPKIKAFSKDADVALLIANLHSFDKISKAEKDGGIIAQFDTASRFRWLTAVRSSVIQTSRPHPGFSFDIEKTATKLFNEIVK